MKISKVLKNKYLRYFFTVICCYLVASVGVNKIVNPILYFTTGDEYQLDYYDENNCLYINVKNLEDSDFFNIYVSDLQYFGSVAYIYSDTNSDEKMYTLLCKGANSIKGADLPSNEGIVYIRVNDLKKYEVTISQITGSERRILDKFSMIKVLISSLLLVIFWRYMRFLKKKYTM